MCWCRSGFAVTKGLVREIVSLVALIGGFILAVLYYPSLGSVLTEFCRTDSVANFVAFLIIFIGCILIGAIVSLIVNRFMKAASIKWIDRILGGIFGLLRGWAIASILVLALIAFPVRETCDSTIRDGAVSSGGSAGGGFAGSSGFEG